MVKTASAHEPRREPSETFCILPWIHLFVEERGLLYPCCRSVDSLRPNVDADKRPHRIHNHRPLEEAWNSEYMRKVRRELLAGERPLPCMRCYMYEDLGIESHRQTTNRSNAHHLERVLADVRPDGWAPLDLRSIDIRLGNLCNLRCRMCSPTSTKALIGEWKKLYGWDDKHPFLAEARTLDWYEQEDFWRGFERHVENVEHLHFAGGEPLLIPQMFAFLRRLIAAGRSRGITLSYNTNLTVLPDELEELWPHFRTVRVRVSVDGYDEVNSFIRYPSKWETLDRNLLTLDRNAARLNCSALRFNTTVQIYNVLRLTELFDYTLERFENFEPFPNLTILSFPPSFSIQVLPPEMKGEAARRLTGYLARLDTRAIRPGARACAELRSRIEGLVEHMEQRDRTSEIPELVRRTEIFDDSRSQRAIDILPELAALFEKRKEAT